MASSAQADSERPRRSATVGSPATGQGVLARASTVSPSTTAAAVRGVHGSDGESASTASRTRATHRSSPSAHSRNARWPGAGTDAGSTAVTAASARTRSGVSGFSDVPTAFTNARLPSAQVTTAAGPGEKPPARGDTVTTGEPSAASIAVRNPAGSRS
ncbi:hypothetical protein [Modestobacter lacusdianchii]